MQQLAFGLFSVVLIISATMVIIARNPVHSVLFLIVTFFNAAALFVLLGAEFLAMILVVVYVGAVAVLFLFVVMMLDIDFVALRSGFMNYLPLGSILAFILVCEFVYAILLSSFAPGAAQPVRALPVPEGVSNTEALGRILYTDYIFYFQTAGMILLVAMIGAIVLTLRHRPGVKRQSISRQIARERATAIEMVDVEPGQGS
jgi:NADH-quinone oxidoreductase subunit J